MKAFHAYDVRGVYGEDFCRDDVYRIGYHLVHYLGVREVVVGRDARVSSPEIHEALVDGITTAGADVLDLGLSTTPMVYYAAAEGGYGASVQITASHNPKQYNGLKISREHALPVGYDSGLQELERRMHHEPIVPAVTRGHVRPMDVRKQYVEFIRGFARRMEGLNVAVDCSNGMAALLVHDILPPSYHYLYDTLDGTFPNHEANPLIPANTATLRQMVVETQSDVGIIFDGDGDRVAFVDETGADVPPDIMLAVMGYYFQPAGGPISGTVLVDIRTSMSTVEHLRSLGASVQSWRVGRAYMASRLRELNGLFGGELAGHYYFRDFFYSDSGLLAAVILLSVVAELKRQGVSLGELVRRIAVYANSGEINFTVQDKAAAMEAVKAYFVAAQTPTAVYDYDGYRVEFEDWWFNIRPSNTEPLLRFLAEAKSPELLQCKVKEARQILAPFEGH